MSTVPRRSARGQTLPPQEAHILGTLRDFNLYARASQLYKAGWTLRAIGEAFSPAKSRSTVASWIERAHDSTPLVDLPPVEAPTLATPETYIPVRPVSPGISKVDRDRIEVLAPIARKFRSGMSPMHAAALANTELTEICTRLAGANVPVRELADAAGVTYRAMAKRIGRA
jgi:hypothetical protein